MTNPTPLDAGGHGFTCPRCGRTSYHPTDKAEGYCGNCHDWTGQPAPTADADAVAVRTQRIQLIAAGVAATRDQHAPHVAVLDDLEQALLRGILPLFPDVDPTLLGTVLLDVGSRLAAVAQRVRRPEQAGAIIVNLLQLAGERLYTRRLPIDYRCPYTLVGGVDCSAVLQAADDGSLRPKVAAHNELNHPPSRADRRHQ